MKYTTIPEVVAIAKHFSKNGESGSSIEVAQETGQSTTSVMSQKATTDELLKKQDKLTSEQILNINKIDDIESSLNEKANANNVYTKSESDVLLNEKADKSNTYTKTEVDSITDDIRDLLAKGVFYRGAVDTVADLDAISKKESGDMYTVLENKNTYIWDGVKWIDLGNNIDLSEYVRKNEVYSKDEADTLLNNKANVSNVYTKAESDNLLSQKANSIDVYTKIESDSLLNNKQNKLVAGDNINIDEDTNVISVDSTIIEGAVLYVEQSKSIEEKKQARENIGIDEKSITDNFEFESSDLVEGKITFTHTRGTESVVIFVYDENGNWILPKETTIINSTMIEVDLSDIDVVGVWSAVVVGGSSFVVSGGNSGAVLYTENQNLTEDEKQLVKDNIGVSQDLQNINDRLDLKEDKTILKDTLEDNLTSNTEYTVELAVDTNINSADGWGVINITSTGDFTLNIPAAHKWADGVDGYISGGIETMVMYDDGRWSRIDWS